MREAAARPRRLDDTAADMGSLVALGHETPPPKPGPPKATPAPTPVDEQEAVALSAALTAAGIETTPGDEAAVRALAALDPATVATVERWLKTKKTKTDTDASK